MGARAEAAAGGCDRGGTSDHGPGADRTRRRRHYRTGLCTRATEGFPGEVHSARRSGDRAGFLHLQAQRAGIVAGRARIPGAAAENIRGRTIAAKMSHCDAVTPDARTIPYPERSPEDHALSSPSGGVSASISAGMRSNVVLPHPALNSAQAKGSVRH